MLYSKEERKDLEVVKSYEEVIVNYIEKLFSDKGKVYDCRKELRLSLEHIGNFLVLNTMFFKLEIKKGDLLYDDFRKAMINTFEGTFTSSEGDLDWLSDITKGETEVPDFIEPQVALYSLNGYAGLSMLNVMDEYGEEEVESIIGMITYSSKGFCIPMDLYLDELLSMFEEKGLMSPRIAMVMQEHKLTHLGHLNGLTRTGLLAKDKFGKKTLKEFGEVLGMSEDWWKTKDKPVVKVKLKIK